MLITTETFSFRALQIHSLGFHCIDFSPSGEVFSVIKL